MRAWKWLTLLAPMLLAAACSNRPDPDDPRLHTGERGIVMLRAEWCGYCRKQEADFQRAQVDYQRLDIDSPEGQRAMRALGVRGVPVTVIGQNVVQGYNTARLQQLLAPLGYQVY